MTLDFMLMAPERLNVPDARFSTPTSLELEVLAQAVMLIFSVEMDVLLASVTPHVWPAVFIVAPAVAHSIVAR
jgi:hypothetical protein